MIHPRLLFTALAASLVLAACGGDPPPPPEPQGPSADELERQRQDSIRAAEAERARQQAIADSIARAQAEAEAGLRAARASLEEVIYFDYDESVIRPDMERLLRAKAEVLRASPAVQLSIEGHTDERGSSEYNLALGNARAEAVRQYFISFGLSGNRFTITSYGEERPVAMGSNESAWARNRRAEFVITAGADQINR